MLSSIGKHFMQFMCFCRVLSTHLCFSFWIKLKLFIIQLFSKEKQKHYFSFESNEDSRNGFDDQMKIKYKNSFLIKIWLMRVSDDFGYQTIFE